MSKEVFKKKNKYKSLWRRDNIDGTVMAMLPFIGYILFSAFPMVFSLLISFTELHGYDFTQMRFLWSDGWTHTFDNYINLFKLEFFEISLINSFSFAIVAPIKLFIQLYIAHLLTKKVPGSKFYRIIYFIPTIISTVAVSVMWNWIFEPTFGIVNTFLALFKIPSLGLIADPNQFMGCVWVLNIWWGGCNVMLMDSALASVDVSLKEAAALDGASEFWIFWKITFPCITPTLFYHLVMNIIASMQEMGLFQVLSNGGVGPGNKALTMTYYMYQVSFGQFSQGNLGGMGMGCAFGWFIAVLIIVITKLQFWLSKKWVHYD